MSRASTSAQNVVVKLIVGAGAAAPSPPVGPALGSKGVKAIDFCKEFNARTGALIAGTPVPTTITIRPDRKFSFTTRTPPTAWLLLRAAGAEKGSAQSLGASVGSVSLKHAYEIARIKQADEMLQGSTLEAVTKTVVATARSAGVKVVP